MQYGSVEGTFSSQRNIQQCASGDTAATFKGGAGCLGGNNKIIRIKLKNELYPDVNGFVNFTRMKLGV